MKRVIAVVGISLLFLLTAGLFTNVEAKATPNALAAPISKAALSMPCAQSNETVIIIGKGGTVIVIADPGTVVVVVE